MLKNLQSNMDEVKTYWLDRHRFLAIAIILLIMWGGFMIFYYFKADEITKDPCSICSKYMGEQVVCTSYNSMVPIHRNYYPNGSIITEKPIINVSIYIPKLPKLVRANNTNSSDGDEYAWG